MSLEEEDKVFRKHEEKTYLDGMCYKRWPISANVGALALQVYCRKNCYKMALSVVYERDKMDTPDTMNKKVS